MKDICAEARTARSIKWVSDKRDIIIYKDCVKDVKYNPNIHPADVPTIMPKYNRNMIIFEYKVSPAWLTPDIDKETSYVRVTNNSIDNVTTFFFGKEYRHTIPEEDIEKIKDIINEYPELLNIRELEPNSVLDGYEYYFAFSNGKKSNNFTGYNILDYGSSPRKNATMALRAARHIKDHVLWQNKIRTTIPNRLQHWPKYRKPSDLIKM